MKKELGIPKVLNEFKDDYESSYGTVWGFPREDLHENNVLCS
jgi:hypothetical protein